jgi:hypothetical protein
MIRVCIFGKDWKDPWDFRAVAKFQNKHKLHYAVEVPVVLNDGNYLVLSNTKLDVDQAQEIFDEGCCGDGGITSAKNYKALIKELKSQPQH